MQTKNKNHFSGESKAYRASIRKAFHDADLHSDFRNKRVGGYTDKYLSSATKVIEVCERIGIEYAPTLCGVIVYIPNQN